MILIILLLSEVHQWKTVNPVQSKNKYLIISFGFIVLRSADSLPPFLTIQHIYCQLQPHALFTLSLFGLLHYGKLNQKIISWLIIFGSNFYILSLLFVNADFPYLFFLFFPIIMSLVYSDKYLHITMLIVTAIELTVVIASIRSILPPNQR